MRTLRRLLFLGLLAAAILMPPHDPLVKDIEVFRIDRAGNESVCSPEFAYVNVPDRSAPHAMALVDDLAYAAAAAGPIGVATLLAAIALVALVGGLWARGLRCGLRRVLVTFGVGVPLGLAFIYISCFLEGRTIRLGPDAQGFVACSLHTQTDRTTGVLSPRELVKWHYQRGFRVLNVSDRDSIEGALEAQRAAKAADFAPQLLVIAGEEWHGHPDLVLVNVARAWEPMRFDREERIEQTVAGVHREGGAAFIAHPWSKLALSLDEALATGVDGVEVVNRIIHGGGLVLGAAARHGKALLGVLDYKFGPHVDALTLIPARLARSPRGVVEAIRTSKTVVLHAIPGGPITGASWRAGRPGLAGAAAGVRSLLDVPRARRLVWVAWLAGICVLWWISGRSGPQARGWFGRPLGTRGARTLLIVCCIVEFVLPAGLSWEVRGIVGPVPVKLLLGAAALFAVPLLAATRVLARAEESA